MVHQSIRRIVGVLIAAALVQIYSVSNHLIRSPDEGNNFALELENTTIGTIGNRNHTTNGTTLLPRVNTNVSQKNVKIVAFTDHSFAPVGQWWYQRMQNLSYTTQTLVLFESKAVVHFDKLKEKGEHYQTDIQLIDEHYTKRRFKIHRLWYIRILYCLNQLKAGQSIVLTDTDNVFLKYVPLELFEQSGYDAIFSFEQKYPEKIFREQGFVLCGGMTYLKATNATIQVMERLLERCFEGWGREGINSKSCDDQVTWNEMLFQDMKWNMNSSQYFVGNRSGFEGESTIVPNFHANIWDQSFAQRGKFEECPLDGAAWVAMPAAFNNNLLKILKPLHGRFEQQSGLDKLSRVLIWENFCSINGTDLNQRMEKAISFYKENFKQLVRPFVNDTRGHDLS